LLLSCRSAEGNCTFPPAVPAPALGSRHAYWDPFRKKRCPKHTETKFGAFIAALFLASANVDARQITLSGMRTPSRRLIGYLVYYGTEAGMYGDPVDVGNLLSWQVGAARTQYYFTAR